MLWLHITRLGTRQGRTGSFEREQRPQNHHLHVSQQTHALSLHPSIEQHDNNLPLDSPSNAPGQISDVWTLQYLPWRAWPPHHHIFQPVDEVMDLARRTIPGHRVCEPHVPISQMSDAGWDRHVGQLSGSSGYMTRAPGISCCAHTA